MGTPADARGMAGRVTGGVARGMAGRVTGGVASIVTHIEIQREVRVDRAGDEMIDLHRDIGLMVERIPVVMVPVHVVGMVVVVPPIPVRVVPLLFHLALFSDEISVVSLGGLDITIPGLGTDVLYGSIHEAFEFVLR